MGFIGRAVAPAPITASDVPDLPTSKITSGTFADARIAASNVTQHLGTAGTLNVGISENNIAQFTTSVSDNDFLKIDGTKVEGRSVSEVKSDLSLDNVTNESKSTMFTNAALTGTPTTPTASASTNTTQIASTAFVTGAINDLIDSAPGTLNTLNEIAAAIGDSPTTGETVDAIINRLTANENRLTTNESTLSGLGTTSTLDVGVSENNVAQFTASVSDNDFLRIDGTKVEGRSASEVLSDIGGQAALTFGKSSGNALKSEEALTTNDVLLMGSSNVKGRTFSEIKSDLSLDNVTNESKSTMFTNAALTGNPTAPTQSAGNNSTRIATTEFVTTAIANNSPGLESNVTFTDLTVTNEAAVNNGLHVKKTDSGNETLPLRVQNDAVGTSSVGIVFTASTSDTFNNAKIVSSRIGGAAKGDLQFFTHNGTSLASRLTINEDGKIANNYTGTIDKQFMIGGVNSSSNALTLKQTTSGGETASMFFDGSSANADFKITYEGSGGTEIVLQHDGTTVLGNAGTVIIDKDTRQSALTALRVKGRARFDSPVSFDDLVTIHDIDIDGDSKVSLGSDNTAAPVSIGYSGLNPVGNYSVAIGSYSANVGAPLSAPGGNQVAIGSGGIINSGATFAIGIGSYFNLNNAAADQAIAIGTYATATNGYAIGIGFNAQAQGNSSLALGKYSTIHASAADAIAIGNNADANNSNSIRAIAIGHDSDASHNDTISIGFDAQSTASGAIAIGATTDSTGGSSIAVGKNSQSTASNTIAIGYSANAAQTFATAIGTRVKSNVSEVTEIGFWSDATTRGSAIRVVGNTGAVQMALQLRSANLTDGGATAGSEADNTLPRGFYQFRRTNTELFFECNSFSQMQRIKLGRLGPGDDAQTNLVEDNSPTFTGLATFERIALSENTFTTITSDTTLAQEHNGATILCANTGGINITLPTQTGGFTTTFIQKGAAAVQFVAGSGVAVNSFGGANTLAGFAAQASVLYDSPSSVFLGGNLV